MVYTNIFQRCNGYIIQCNRTYYEQLRPWDTEKVASQKVQIFLYEMSFLGMTRWPAIGGWLPIKVDAQSRLYCSLHSAMLFNILLFILKNWKNMP